MYEVAHSIPGEPPQLELVDYQDVPLPERNREGLYTALGLGVLAVAATYAESHA
jgi:hypothetical protein